LLIISQLELASVEEGDELDEQDELEPTRFHFDDDYPLSV